MEKNPEAIIRAHLDYINAGAQCITTSSYQASIPGLIAIGYKRSSAEKLILKSIQLAEIAIKTALDSGVIDNKPLIAASVGPYGAYLADGSEYRGNYAISDKILRDFHLERMRILDRSNADILACETIPSFQEAGILSEILLNVDTPAWISFSCKDGKTSKRWIKNQRMCLRFLKIIQKVFAVGVKLHESEIHLGFNTVYKSKLWGQ